MDNFELIFQPCEFGFHVTDRELDDGDTISGGLSAFLLE